MLRQLTAGLTLALLGISAIPQRTEVTWTPETGPW